MVLPAIFLFIIGTFFGSFLSVIIYRIHKEKKGIIKGRSECPYCHKRLAVQDLIPIFSYLISAGKCRFCKKKISIHYLLIELFSGIIFAVFYFMYPFFIYEFGTLACNFDSAVFLNYLFFTVVSLFLILIFFYDLKYLLIPEIFTFPAIALIFVVGIFTPEPGLYSMLIGGAIAGLFFGFQFWISKEKWLGFGDVQVGILMGLLLGWQMFLMGLFITYIIGSIISLILMVSKKVGLKSQVPFAPFMIIGTFVTIFFGEYLLNLYLNALI
jgi:prepilin signal peptidase PulO-like enzyme (type II secretory pathway)